MGHIRSVSDRDFSIDQLFYRSIVEYGEGLVSLVKPEVTPKRKPNTRKCPAFFVPRDGIEPPTRGLSEVYQRLLRMVP